MYQIPILHPVLVHFPIAFILLAAVTSLAWLAWGNRFWRNATLLLLLAGFLGGLGAYFTGEAAEKFGEGNPRVEQFEEQHESSALLTLVATGLSLFVLAAYMGATRRLLPTAASGDGDLPVVRVVVAVLTVASAVLVARTGHLGGLMVWGQPVGAAQGQATDQQAPPSGEREEHQEKE